MADLDERLLLEGCQAGDSTAFAALVMRYRKRVYGYLVRCGVEVAMRDDLFQDIFLKIHRAAGSYRRERPVAPWVFTIVANTVRSHFRKARLRRLVVSAPVDPPDVAATSEEEAEARETARNLTLALTKLPLRQREVVLLSCVENLSQQDVALVLGLPLGTVKTLLHRARAGLALALASSEGTP